MDRKIACLRNVKIYEGISEEELIKITDKAVEVSVSQGTTLYSPDNPAKHVYILKEGEIELYLENEGKKVALETLMPGDVFGDFGSTRTKHFAVATRRSYLCQTPTEEFLDIVRHYPEIALRLMQVLAEKTEYYENKIASLARPAKEQILDELKKLATGDKDLAEYRPTKKPMVISLGKWAGILELENFTITGLIPSLLKAFVEWKTMRRYR